MPLRPLGLGELYDGAFQAIRANPVVMLGVSAAVVVVIEVLNAFGTRWLVNLFPALEEEGELTDEQVQEFATAAGSAVGGLLTLGIVQQIALWILTGLLIVSVSRSILGQTLSPAELWERIRGRVWRLIGLSLLLALAIGAAVVALYVPGILVLAVGGSGALAGLLFFLGFLAMVVIGPLLYVRWSMASQTLLLEKRGVFASLGRSWRLVKGSFWRVLGILLLTSIIVGIGSSIIAFPFAIAGAGGTAFLDPEGPVDASATSLVVSGIGNVIAMTLLVPFQAAVTALLYVDLRMRREGLDADLIRASGVGDAAPPLSPPPPAPPASYGGPDPQHPGTGPVW